MNEVRLTKLEAAALAYLRRHGVMPSVVHSEVQGGIITLRDELRNELAVIADGIEVSRGSSADRAGFAAVVSVKIEMGCYSCGRRFLRPGGEYAKGEMVTCPRCSSVNILPSDPLAASREVQNAPRVSR